MIRDQQRVHFEPIKIVLNDIVLILAKVWPDCYGDISWNIKVIVEWGWGPLNRGVLHHPDILRTKRSIESIISITTNTHSNMTNESTTNNNLLDNTNVSSRTAYSVLAKLATAKRRDLGREQQFEKQLTAT